MTTSSSATRMRRLKDGPPDPFRALARQRRECGPARGRRRRAGSGERPRCGGFAPTDASGVHASPSHSHFQDSVSRVAAAENPDRLIDRPVSLAAHVCPHEPAAERRRSVCVVTDLVSRRGQTSAGAASRSASPDPASPASCRELEPHHDADRERAEWIGRPISAAHPGGAAARVIAAGLATRPCRCIHPRSPGSLPVIQVLESGSNDVVLVGAGVFFLLTLETASSGGARWRPSRSCRHRAHHRHAPAHKDPEWVFGRARRPAASGAPVSRFQLSATSITAARCCPSRGKLPRSNQDFRRRRALAAVNDGGELTTASRGDLAEADDYSMPWDRARPSEMQPGERVGRRIDSFCRARATPCRSEARHPTRGAAGEPAPPRRHRPHPRSATAGTPLLRPETSPHVPRDFNILAIRPGAHGQTMARNLRCTVLLRRGEFQRRMDPATGTQGDRPAPWASSLRRRLELGLLRRRAADRGRTSSRGSSRMRPPRPGDGRALEPPSPPTAPRRRAGLVDHDRPRWTSPSA